MTQTLACQCGAVRLEAEGEPMITAECYCTSCRTASGRIEAIPGAPHIRNAEGGTPYVLYRKDRVRFTTGTEQLREFRLKPDSPTRRVVAACCNTLVFTEFSKGHWLSLNAQLWPSASRPAMQLRTMTGDLPEDVVLDDRLPKARTQTLTFFRKLLVAWAAMGFRVPRLDFVKGEFRA